MNDAYYMTIPKCKFHLLQFILRVTWLKCWN